MLEAIRPLFDHLTWADCGIWTAIERCEAARTSPEIAGRLYHLHVVQHAFWMIWQGRRIAVPRAEELPTLVELRPFAMAAHRQLAGFAAAVAPERLAETARVPWFKDPPLVATVGDTMLQVASHSTHHRGQIASRLRSLGGEPPTLDYIAWVWKGRPSGGWE